MTHHKVGGGIIKPTPIARTGITVHYRIGGGQTATGRIIKTRPIHGRIANHRGTIKEHNPFVIIIKRPAIEGGDIAPNRKTVLASKVALIRACT